MSIFGTILHSVEELGSETGEGIANVAEGAEYVITHPGELSGLPSSHGLFKVSTGVRQLGPAAIIGAGAAALPFLGPVEGALGVGSATAGDALEGAESAGESTAAESAAGSAAKTTAAGAGGAAGGSLLTKLTSGASKLIGGAGSSALEAGGIALLLDLYGKRILEALTGSAAILLGVYILMQRPRTVQTAVRGTAETVKRSV